MEGSMNKSEFLKAVAEKANLTQKQAGAAYDAAYEVLAEVLKAGDKLQLIGLGTAEVKVKPAREGVNPATKAKIKIPACKVPSFKFGKAFKELF